MIVLVHSKSLLLSLSFSFFFLNSNEFTFFFLFITQNNFLFFQCLTKSIHLKLIKIIFISISTWNEIDIQPWALHIHASVYPPWAPGRKIVENVECCNLLLNSLEITAFYRQFKIYFKNNEITFYKQ